MTVASLNRRDVLVSIRPIYAGKIMNGRKTVELRRRFPSTLAAGTVALIYSSSPVRAIVGYARIKEVCRLPIAEIWDRYNEDACIDRADFDSYFAGVSHGYAILLDGVKQFSCEVHAITLQRKFGFVPPQSFRYLGDEFNSLLSDEHLQIPD